jgi:hypothetical protein
MVLLGVLWTMLRGLTALRPSARIPFILMEPLEQSSNAKTPQLGINPEYVTGLSEAGATLTYVKNGNSTNLRFAIKLPEGDKYLIFALQQFFQAGNVYKSGNSWMYCATSLAAIEKIVAHFARFPMQGHKQREFALWRQMFDLKRIPRKSNAAAVSALADELTALKGRS